MKDALKSLLISEHKDMDIKISSLEVLINRNPNIDKEDMRLLKLQLHAMRSYASVLEWRIDRLNN